MLERMDHFRLCDTVQHLLCFGLMGVDAKRKKVILTFFLNTRFRGGVRRKNNPDLALLFQVDLLELDLVTVFVWELCRYRRCVTGDDLTVYLDLGWYVCRNRLEVDSEFLQLILSQSL